MAEIEFLSGRVEDMHCLCFSWKTLSTSLGTREQLSRILFTDRKLFQRLYLTGSHTKSWQIPVSLTQPESKGNTFCLNILGKGHKPKLSFSDYARQILIICFMSFTNFPYFQFSYSGCWRFGCYIISVRRWVYTSTDCSKRSSLLELASLVLANWATASDWTSILVTSSNSFLIGSLCFFPGIFKNLHLHCDRLRYVISLISVASDLA